MGANPTARKLSRRYVVPAAERDKLADACGGKRRALSPVQGYKTKVPCHSSIP
jgi:hypothetical protein